MLISNGRKDSDAIYLENPKAVLQLRELPPIVELAGSLRIPSPEEAPITND